MAASAWPSFESVRGIITAFDSTCGRLAFSPSTDRAHAGSDARCAAVWLAPGPETMAFRGTIEP
ncbi:MAG: hypothetical protein JOZ25_09905 [Actinobacteria bacterium]|nr:hypothetical protein [Actinomycetota bacterium]